MRMLGILLALALVPAATAEASVFLPEDGRLTGTPGDAPRDRDQRVGAVRESAERNVKPLPGGSG